MPVHSNPALKKIHFLGIAGTGMSGLAEYALKEGCIVSGSDTRETPVTARLTALGAVIHHQHSPANLGCAETVVYSSAIKDDNPEFAAAKTTGLDIIHRSTLLARFMRGKNSVTVAGTHGKTTTSALLTHVIASCGGDPSAILGGVMLDCGSNARIGTGDFFVAEADESDGTFLNYEPVICALTNIDHDHLDFYGTFDKVKEAYRQYLKTADPDFGVVCCWDDPVVREVSESIGLPRLTYGTLLGSEVRAIDLQSSGYNTTFTAIVERDRLSCRIPLIGKHNVLNALCALAVARVFGLDIRAASESLEGFAGVERRMQLIKQASNLLIFDDYAHNPGKIQACISGVRAAWPSHHVTVIHQPHRYSRIETMRPAMINSFRGSDRLILLPVFEAGESRPDGFDLSRLADDIGLASATKVEICDDNFEACQRALQLSQHPAIILTVGAGDVWKVSHMLRERIGG